MEKAVITGDIVQSTKLKPEERTWLIKSLQKAFKGWDKEYGIKSEIYRGDSFQCLLDDTKFALRFALQIRTYIRSLNQTEHYNITLRKNPSESKNILLTRWTFDARLAIGIGEIEKPMSNIKISDGEAFQLSGRRLDEIKSSRQMMAIKTNDKFDKELSTEIILLDYVLSKTTALQSQVIYFKLRNFTEIEIAKRIKIGQSAVNQRSIAAGWYSVQAAIERFEEIYNFNKLTI